MHTNRSFFSIACRAAAFSFLIAGTASWTQAQQAPTAAATPLLLASASAPDSSSAAAYSSSSSSSSSDTLADGRLNLSSEAFDASQPPPRRRYGNPNYSDSHTNADGSDKYVFLGGIGFTLPIGNTHKYDTTSYGFQFGGGRQYNKKYAVLAQFDYDHFNLQGSTITNQEIIYNYGCSALQQSEGLCGVSGLAGNAHVWSFTLNPTYTLPIDGKIGGYVVAGGGFYHKVTNFAEPEAEESCYIYCEEYEVDANIDHYTSNAVGFSGGFGVTYKLSHFSNQRFYMEARYVLMLNSQRTGYTAANVATTKYSGYDAFPANSNRTTYIPVKFGIRF
jgi:hypothetical protein